MGDTMPWSGIGMVIGGTISGLVMGAVWWSKHLQRAQRNETGEHGGIIRREEFTLNMTELRTRLDETASEAREARAAAGAAQSALATIGQMIESSMRSLGDRLEGALRDVKIKQDDHTEQLGDHHGRLRAIETELKLSRRHDD